MPKLEDLLSGESYKQILENSRRTRKLTDENKQHKKDIAKKISVPDFVAIDFETTGLDAKRDRIIEVGAVKFINRKPSDEFCSFVNPDIPVPENITELTGIKTDDLKDAPGFNDICDRLVTFIGNLPICAHQVDFDYNFLNEELKRAGREKINNQQLDTAVIARLLISDLAGYSLSNVSEYMDINLKNAHRALDDARACGMIASGLLPQLANIPEDTRRTIGKFAPYSELKRILLWSVEKGIENVFQEPERLFKKSYKRLSIPEESEKIDKSHIENCFKKTGTLFGLINGYSERVSQINMALCSADALNRQEYFISEAGTGTGKSMAYLIPAAFWAMKNECRVLVSTHTKNLQDQLFTKDLPIVKKVVGKGFRYSILKGRSNYLCRYRWKRFLSGEIGNLSKRERFGVLPLIRWATETKDGDIETQNQFNRKWFPKVWSLLSADSHGCLGRECPFFSSCFLQYARLKALSSHIVVINHALFFSDVCSESSFLGKIGPLIFDEAHHLESCGHIYLRIEIDTNRINRYIESLNNVDKVLKNSPVCNKENEAFIKLKKTLRKIRKDGNKFLTDLSSWAGTRAKDRDSSYQSSIYQISYSNDPFFGFSSLAGFKISLSEIYDVINSIQKICDDNDNVSIGLNNDLKSCVEKTSQLKADLDYLTKAVTEEHVFWTEGDLKKGWVKLCGVPLDIGNFLYRIWKVKSGGTIFTSATMAVSGTIDYFRRKTGLFDELDDLCFFKSFSSPFTGDQILQCAVSDREIEPNMQDYDDYVADSIVKLIKNIGRNMLVLFTANSSLNNVFGILKSRRKLPSDSTLLAQGHSGAKATLLKKLNDSEKCILLGTGSFWEGIDAPGKACEIVVIPRLPFSVPTHPVTKALAQRIETLYGNSFFNYSVPEAVIRFRQGAGRLIRSVEDRGALVVLDSRIINKSYGKAFVDSLEGDFTGVCNMDEMIMKISSFFDNMK